MCACVRNGKPAQAFLSYRMQHVRMYVPSTSPFHYKLVLRLDVYIILPTLVDILQKQLQMYVTHNTKLAHLDLSLGWLDRPHTRLGRLRCRLSGDQRLPPAAHPVEGVRVELSESSLAQHDIKGWKGGVMEEESSACEKRGIQ